VREGDINRMKELGAQWQLSVGVVGVKKDVACSGIEVGVPGTHRKIAICGKLATAPPTAWTHCGVDMPPLSTHSSFQWVEGSNGPLVQQRRITRYKYRVWQHQSNPEHQRKWPSDYPSCDKSYVVSDKKLGPGVENFMFWWPTASRCTPKPDEILSVARDVLQSSYHGLLFQPSGTGTNMVRVASLKNSILGYGVIYDLGRSNR
jgi:hypothetical protein